MIRGLHGLFYSSDAAATRAFLRDQLRLPHTDVGEGWLIFDLPEADVGVHPLDDEGRPPAGTHDVSFFCDDIHGTVADLSARGVRFRSEVEDHGYGFVTYFTMPGGIEVQLYEPKYTKRRSKKPTRSRVSKTPTPPRATGARKGKRARSSARARRRSGRHGA